MMHIEAITATGRTRRVAPGAEFEQEANLLVGRHPQLELFVRSPTTTLFHIDMTRHGKCCGWPD